MNDAPNAVDDVLTTAEDTAGAPLNVLANDSDVDGDALAVTTLTPTAGHGTVSCTAAGSCTYTPALNYNGPDSFTYSISDGNGGSDGHRLDHGNPGERRTQCSRRLADDGREHRRKRERPRQRHHVPRVTR